MLDILHSADSVASLLTDILNDLNKKYTGKFVTSSFTNALVLADTYYEIRNFTASIESSPGNPTLLSYVIRCHIIVNPNTGRVFGVPYKLLNLEDYNV